MGTRLLLFALGVCAAAGAATLNVPSQYPTIQAALDAAHAGDTVLVQPGTYHEALIVPGLEITLLSAAGARLTIVDATGLHASVVNALSTTKHQTIQGFTLTGGSGTEFSPGVLYGGGVFALGKHVVLRECSILGNTALGTAAGAGGGVWGSELIEHCEISDNHALVGGGVYEPLALTGCTLVANTAQYQGGGLQGSCPLTDCTFERNEAGTGGGLYGGPANWLRVTFRENVAVNGGGCAIYFSSFDSPFIASSAFVSNATFVRNRATAHGSAIWFYNDSDDWNDYLFNCVLIDNAPAVADVYSIYDGYGNSLQITSCTLVHESILPSGISNSIFLDPVTFDHGASVLSYSDVPPWLIDAGPHNLSADPLFADLAHGDVHLLADSPCRNAGAPGASSGTDLDGDPRVLEGTTDMGADEFAPDCNANGIKDWQDILAGTSSDCDQDGIADECEPLVDCNGNGLPDACDVASGRSYDCDHDGVPDECQPFRDCNFNGVPDACEIASGASTDCDHDGVPDECESLSDCNGNGLPDICESGDCNGNGLPDVCDIAAGTSLDLNQNGHPDECEHVIHVPSDKPTLLAAVQAAVDGDAIVLEPGVYTGPENFGVSLSKSIELTGATDANECVLDAGGLGRILTIEKASTSVLVRNLTLRHGSMKGGGGAIDVTEGASLTLRGCRLGDDVATKGHGGALRIEQGARADVRNCVFAGNTASQGGAIAVDNNGSSLLTTNCSFDANSATGGPFGTAGSSIRVAAGCVAQLTDVIVRGGAGDDQGLAVAGAGAQLGVSWCDVEGGQAGVYVTAGGALDWGAGNFDADPLFKDAAAQDLHLSGGSPCIDSGDPSQPADADGTPADMGALPFQPFTDAGHALSGALGSGQLAGSGTGAAGSPVSLALGGAPPAAGATLFLGATLGLLSFKGGTMVPDPLTIAGPFAVAGDGTLQLTGPLPSSVPSGFIVTLQFWWSDAGGPQGFAASNGLILEVR
jgi:hypothetical protein